MQQPTSFSLPNPDPVSAAHSERVADYIRGKIREAGGTISFADYMHHCLYAPGLGYYSAGSRKFGPSGDFVTAPEVSSVFGSVIARQCAGTLREIESSGLLEFGAGSGKLAVDILRELSRTGDLGSLQYRIVEVSADLRQRQEALVREEIPDLANRIEWLDELPTEFRGVVIANELLDALPVERFVRRAHGVVQVCVGTSSDGFRLAERPAPESLSEAVGRIEESLGQSLPPGYRSDVCLAAPQWVEELSNRLSEGIVLLFDYGVGRREYYSPERSGGWFRCHFRHHVHNNPMILPGIQDMTAWVDFTAVAEAAAASGLDVAGFVTQAQFLIGGGIDELMAEFADLPTDAQLKLSAEIKLLTLPSEMGEHFKCLALSQGDAAIPRAFSFADRTATLG